MKQNFLLASKAYSESIPLRLLIKNSIPIIGEYIDALTVEPWSKYKSQRIDIFISCVEEEFKLIEKQYINKKYINSIEFLELFSELLDRSKSSKDDEFIKIYARVLKSNLDTRVDLTFEPEDYIEIIRHLTIRDIRIIKIIRNIRTKINETKIQDPSTYDFINVKHFEKENIHFKPNEIKFSLAKLTRLGLLDSYTANSFGMTNASDYRENDVFNEFCSYLLTFDIE
jgi:hypothetical protein